MPATGLLRSHLHFPRSADNYGTVDPYLWATADPEPKANPCAIVEAIDAIIPPPWLFWTAGACAAGRGAGGALKTDQDIRKLRRAGGGNTELGFALCLVALGS